MKIFVLHWFPLEQYPPAMNLLDCLGADTRFQIQVLSTHNDRGMSAYTNSSLMISRTTFPGRTLGRIARILAFLTFPLVAIWKLIRFRPEVVLYFEPHSSLPVSVYHLINRSARVFVHYHEYYAPEHFKTPGMQLIRLQHCLERKLLYGAAEWISQTNRIRLEMFRKDHLRDGDEKLRILPNLPPPSWPRGVIRNAPRSLSSPCRIVYVGSISLEDTWIQEVVNWVMLLPPDTTTLDIYTHNCTADAAAFLRLSSSSAIRFHEAGIPYESLPSLLPGFDVGLILYRASTINYVYNETNKLFEYISCGLDVWFPPQMKAICRLVRDHVRPRIMEVDFQRLPEIGSELLRAASDLPFVPYDVRCDNVLSALATALTRGTTEATGSHEPV